MLLGNQISWLDVDFRFIFCYKNYKYYQKILVWFYSSVHILLKKLQQYAHNRNTINMQTKTRICNHNNIRCFHHHKNKYMLLSRHVSMTSLTCMYACMYVYDIYMYNRYVYDKHELKLFACVKKQLSRAMVMRRLSHMRNSRV